MLGPLHRTSLHRRAVRPVGGLAGSHMGHGLQSFAAPTRLLENFFEDRPELVSREGLHDVSVRSELDGLAH